AAHGTAEHSYAVWTGSPDANASVAITLGAPIAPTYAGVIARANAGAPEADHYAAYVGPDGAVALARRHEWIYSYLGTGPQVSGGGHRIQLTATGAGPVSLIVTLDGATVITATDSSPQALTAAGRAGIFDYIGASRPLQHFTICP